MKIKLSVTFTATLLVVDGGLTVAKEIEEHIKNLKIYPNPGNNFIWMDFDLTKTENLLIQITDLAGKIVESFLKENISAGKQQIIYKTDPLKKDSI